MQNDYSIINRRIEENGLSEASAPWNEDVGFLAYAISPYLPISPAFSRTPRPMERGRYLPFVRSCCLPSRHSCHNTIGGTWHAFAEHLPW